MLKIHKVFAGYGDVEVLKGVDMEVGDGQIVALIGANAAGKSTLIRAISGLIRIRSGRITWDDNEVANESPVVSVANGIIQVPEGRRLFPFMTVEENLELGAFNPRARPSKDNTLNYVYQLFPVLQDKRMQMAGFLSGGEQQMCAIGRGLMALPKLLLLDEPSLGLAPKVVEQIFRVISEINASGMAILLVEQNVRQSLQIAERGYVLEQGTIVLSGVGKDLINDARLKAAYLGM